MAKLEGKTIVVAGGTGRVGEGLVRSFLLEGARVIVPVRSTAKDQRLRSYVEGIDTGKLVCLPKLPSGSSANGYWRSLSESIWPWPAWEAGTTAIPCTACPTGTGR